MGKAGGGCRGEPSPSVMGHALAEPLDPPPTPEPIRPPTPLASAERVVNVAHSTDMQLIGGPPSARQGKQVVAAGSFCDIEPMGCVDIAELVEKLVRKAIVDKLGQSFRNPDLAWCVSSHWSHVSVATRGK